MGGSTAEGIWNKVLLVSLGVALSFAAQYLNSNHEASLERSQQRYQFLMDKRLSALDKFADTLSENGQVFDKLDDFQWALIQARESPESDEAWSQVLITSRAFIAAEVSWDAALRARSEVMLAVFKSSFPQPPFPPSRSLPPIAPALYTRGAGQRKRRIDLADKMFSETQTIHSGLVRRMNSYQGFLRQMSAHVY